ncbi:MAG: glucose-6-phosphate isomerase, partial [Actinomycetota bacterium]|nr:glucose-6-phosphate isomerase [Actinomycetota bacterium]
MVDLTESSQWKELVEHSSSMRSRTLRDLISDQNRLEVLSFDEGNLFFDFSKQLVSSETIGLLTDLAERAGLTTQIAQLFAGEFINRSENRPALHTALRMPTTSQIKVEDQDVIPIIQDSHERAFDFAHRIRTKQWLGATGLPISSVVNIGIGGS